jgi:hypothetical protein
VAAAGALFSYYGSIPLFDLHYDSLEPLENVVYLPMLRK